MTEPQPKPVEELWVYTCMNKQGEESVVIAPATQTNRPFRMVFTDRAEAQSDRNKTLARSYARTWRLPVKLKRYHVAEVEAVVTA